ncbi:arginine utilization regulatory protein [Caminicella sporogenes DSM 14501]|uniref:Arginine utilization regulatory protein n=1 Tax=Caminicella sporogenes DSM 14501 TaxID=1121266 RepID=A0A1M6LZY6_9FIRM|nr:sigma 54-interacting transcriptional regulator [Caminicella sporogenes]RKD28010.1 sigma-54-dependent Fis family transcriptional regulator [Caminicella sporogenes]SHJ76744.1 arginine utilization regulatory protein [Caminicella sporogenes DSM 14501]
MKNKILLEKLLQNILQYIEEGIHVIDSKGKTIIYNSVMSEMEGLDKEQVIGKHILDVFPTLTEETSTLLKVLRTGKMIEEYKQSYLNLKGKKVSSINTTLPIINNGKVLGAIEIARNMTKVSQLSEQIINLRQKLNRNYNINKKNEKKHYTFDNLIGQNKKFLKAIAFARRAAQTSSSVLIYGETGTGKELFAQSIHYESRRKEKPFIAQNCAAIPETLLESILFGTSKGSFTGAVDRPGLFEQASGGTLFLDEINSMSLPLQAKLLRVLQEGYIRRIGGLKDIPVDVRIIAATNEDPLEAIKKGILRKDLYYRINVINIKIPPLRKRKDDIPLLIKHFINYYNEKLNKDVWMMSEELLEAFMNYGWPGNVRELQNFIESAMNMIFDEHVIKKEHLPYNVEELILNGNNKNINRDSRYDKVNDLSEYLANIEKEIILNHLIKNDYNITKTSKNLGISRQNLQYKLKKYRLI